MQIDDPIDAAKQQDETGRRSELIPFKEETGTALAALCSIAAAGSSGSLAVTLTVGAAVWGGLQSLAASVGMRRQQELIYALHREFHEQGTTKEYLEGRLKGAKTELQELVAESVVRASEAKSAEGVKRIAKLLTKILMTSEEVDIAEARAMLDIAGSLFDFDAFALGRMYQEQSPSVSGRSGNVDINDTRDSWSKLRDKNSEFRSSNINAAGSRLQGHGLAMRVEVGPQAFGLDTYVFSITDFGIRFCRWCLFIN